MTSLFLAGGENPSHQQVLSSCAVMQVAVNVTSLLRRSTGSWKLDLPYTDWEWAAYCDGPATIEDLDFVCEHATRPPRWIIGPEAWSESNNYLPLWNGEGGIPPERPLGMVVTDRVFKDRLLSRRALASRSVGATLGAITGSIDPDIGRYDIIVSGSWWSSMKYGETQVWDGQRMHRYSADRQGEVRTRHLDHIAALGVDVDLVLLNDPDESARLAILSWQAYEEHLSGARVLPMSPRPEVVATQRESEMALMDSGSDGIDMVPHGTRHRVVLPGVAVGTLQAPTRQGDGTEILEEQAILQSVSESIRTCDNCFLGSAGCPGFRPESSCAYSIPVEIRTKDQLQGVLQAMIELQTQRVLQARFAEEITGQELTPEVGREMDRLFASVEKMRDIMDNRDSIKMTVEARGRSGVLSRLFGDRVGDNARMLSQPVDSNDVLDAVLEPDE